MHRNHQSVILLAVLLFTSSGLSAQRIAAQTVTVPTEVAHYPDIVVYNGKVVTMDDFGQNLSLGSIAQAMAVRDGKIMAVGSSREVLELAGTPTRKYDLKGRVVIPGIINTHIHLHDGALSRWLDKNPVEARRAVGLFPIVGNTPDELRHRVQVVLKENVANMEDGKWAFLNLPRGPQGTGTGLGVDFIRDEEVTQAELDEWAPKNPVLLTAHPNYMINSHGRDEIKKMYSVEPDMQIEEGHAVPLGYSPVGVEFRRAVIVDGYFSTNLDLLAEIVLGGLEQAAAAGMTTFSSHIQGINNFDSYMLLLRKYGRLPIRFAYTDHAGFHASPERAADFYFRMGNRVDFGTDFFWQTAIGAGFIDSGPPAMCTTIDTDPDRKKNEWCRIAPGTVYNDAMYKILSRGQRVAVGHNYGDKSADFFMDLIEKAIQENPQISLEYVRSQRYTLDHCGLYPRPDQLPRMRRLGVLISCDEGSMTRMVPWLEEVYGKDKEAWISPNKDILAAGVHLAWATEGPWLEKGIFDSMESFVTRKNRNGLVINGDQAVDRVTVMKMATSWAAYFIKKEAVLGMLKPGFWADFVVLNQDYFTVPEENIDQTVPLMTVVGGETVLLRESFASELGAAPVGAQITFDFEGE